jgi:Niemann-Pick C2 protein
VKNTVYAKIAGIPFPFIGVDGTDACHQIFLPDDSKAGCPLKAGQEYVYKNNLKVLEIYPKVRIHVFSFTTTIQQRRLNSRGDTEK